MYKYFKRNSKMESRNIRNKRYIMESFNPDDSLEDLWNFIQEQEFDSSVTSINSSQLPAIFNNSNVKLNPGTINLDYGGGKFDNVAEYLKDKDVINLVYDPFNRSKEHNKEVLQIIKKNGGADTITCSNVLNVIQEPDIRLSVLLNMERLIKSGGTCYITVYEGNGSGQGKSNTKRNSYQTNMKTSDYIEEIEQVFSKVTRKGKLIIAQ